MACHTRSDALFSRCSVAHGGISYARGPFRPLRRRAIRRHVAFRTGRFCARAPRMTCGILSAMVRRSLCKTDLGWLCCRIAEIESLALVCAGWFGSAAMWDYAKIGSTDLDSGSAGLTGFERTGAGCYGQAG